MNRPYRALIIIALISIVLMFPLMFTVTQIAGNYGDVYLHYYPLKCLVQEHLIRGEMPLWNPFIFAGQPLQANPQSAVFYPFSLLFYFLPLPAAFNYFYLVHFVIAGFLFFLFLRSLHFRQTGALLGAVAFGFSSFMVYKVPAGHPAAFSGYVWLPLVMMTCAALNKYPKRFAYALLLGGTLCVQFLSGHTFPVYISLVFILFHSVFTLFSYWRGLLIAGAVSMLVSALQFVPTLELSQVTERSNWASLAANYSLPLRNMVNLLMPNYFGNVIDGTYVFPDNPSYFFERHALYIGILPLLLAVSGLYFSLRKKRFFFPMLVVAGLLLALGFNTPVYHILYGHFPAMDLLRVPARFYYLSIAGLCLLAVIGWEHLFAGRSRWIKLLLLALVAGDLLWWGYRFIYPESMDAYRSRSEITSILDPFYRAVTEPQRIPPNKSMLYHHYNLNGYEAIMLQDFTRYMGLQEKQVLTPTGLAKTDIGSPTAKGFAVKYHVTLDEEQHRLVTSLGNGLKVYATEDPLPRVFVPKMLHDFRRDEVLEEIEYLRITGRTPAEEITVMGLPPDFPKLSGGGRLAGYGISSSRITTDVIMNAPGALVFSEIYYPGWQAYAKGEPADLRRGNKVFRTVLLSKGSFTGNDRVYLVFRPVSWRIGLYLTLASLVMLLLIMLKYYKVLLI